MSVTLKTGRGKNKREWKLTEEEFKEFEMMFEECELIEIGPDFHLGKLVQVDPPEVK